MDRLSLEGTCVECDLLYYETRDRLPLRTYFAMGFLLPCTLFVALISMIDLPTHSGGFRAITTGFPVLDLAVMTLIVAWFTGKAAVVARAAWHRHTLDR